MAEATSGSDRLELKFWPKQRAAFESLGTEILYGGAAGGGKSYLMRVAAINWCGQIAGLQVYLFRRIYGDLVLNHMEGPAGFRNLLAGFVAGGWCKVLEEKITFWNGSVINLCHCQHDTDVYKYQGAEMHVLLIDELTHFTETMYRFLRHRNRMVGLKIPEAFAGQFPRIMCSANPGNIGHLWVKNTWIVGSTPMALRRMPGAEGGMLRQFIPARLEDNPSMAEDDPGYEQRLEGLGSQTLVAAMRWGDWDVVEGAFFDCWETRKHVVPPFAVPRDWVRFRSGDWGSASPSSFGWWAVVQDDYHLDVLAGDEPSLDKRGPRGRVLPRGALVRYRELYTDTEGVTGKGVKYTAEELAQKIIELEKDDPKLVYGVLDPSVFKQESGPSIAERMNNVLIRARVAAFHKADNARVRAFQGSNRRGPLSGWDVLRHRMTGKDGIPMIYCFSTCYDSIRTIPVLQHDPGQPEDVSKNSEDHCADEWRYAALSRPWLRHVEPPPVPKDGYSTPHEELIRDSFLTM